MVCMVDDADDAELPKESRERVDCVDADEERRREVRRLLAERRRRRVWKRGILVDYGVYFSGPGENEELGIWTMRIVVRF